jgi:hypothetical protein
MNLAPLRFARVLSQHNGPVERIEYGRVEVDGRPMYQAQAYLSGHLNLKKPRHAVFGTADGTGTHPVAMVARHLALSEAIERWALYYLGQSGLDHPYGFDVDPGSTGLAAYPGLLKRQARARARAEAVERFCLVAWWNGDLQAGLPRETGNGIRMIELANPLSRDTVLITWRRAREGFHAYGFAGAPSHKAAYRKAVIEMERAVVALGRFYLDNPGFEADDLDTLAHPLERRVLYFSLPEGHRRFMERVDSPFHGDTGAPTEPVIDRWVEGPWNRYATVWRVLYPMPTLSYLNPHLNFFLW